MNKTLLYLHRGCLNSSLNVDYTHLKFETVEDVCEFVQLDNTTAEQKGLLSVVCYISRPYSVIH